MSKSEKQRKLEAETRFYSDQMEAMRQYDLVPDLNRAVTSLFTEKIQSLQKESQESIEQVVPVEFKPTTQVDEATRESQATIPNIERPQVAPQSQVQTESAKPPRPHVTNRDIDERRKAWQERKGRPVVQGEALERWKQKMAEQHFNSDNRFAFKGTAQNVYAGGGNFESAGSQADLATAADSAAATLASTLNSLANIALDFSRRLREIERTLEEASV